jgi:hypothetical protein
LFQAFDLPLNLAIYLNKNAYIRAYFNQTVHLCRISTLGERKDEVSPDMAYNTYLNRYDIEHFFRFG